MSIIKKAIKKAVGIVEQITNTTIDIKRKPRVRIKVHPKAVSDGTSMALYVDLVNKFCNYVPKNIFEIGANYAQDAEFLRKSFNLKEQDVYVFEPHPQIFAEIKKMFNFNAFQIAVSNKNGRTKFNAIDIDNNEYKNSGISSLRDGLLYNKKNFIEVDIEMTRMDSFMQKHNIDAIDFLKIDVEGMTYEVLEGFGSYLKNVKAIQLEAEYKQYWKDQKLYEDIEQLLKINGFKLVYFMLWDGGIQSDSFWIQEQYLKQSI
jgi:FkbM family methyltransferase